MKAFKSSLFLIDIGKRSTEYYYFLNIILLLSEIYVSIIRSVHGCFSSFRRKQISRRSFLKDPLVLKLYMKAHKKSSKPMLATIHLFYDCVLDFYHRGVSICFLI